MMKMDFTFSVQGDDADVADMLREVKGIISRLQVPVEVAESSVDIVPALAPYKVEALLERIMVLLEEHSPRTVTELARLVGRNEAAVRRHAARLEGQNKVRIERRMGPPGMTLHLI